MISYGQTDIGQIRKVNQDSIFLSDGPVGKLSNLFLVADGMGGHKAGDFASRFVVQTMSEFSGESKLNEPVSILLRSIERTNELLYDESIHNADREGMGSTLVAATIEGSTMYVANVGDSRLYLLRESLEQITRDHSLVEEMVARGQILRDSESYKNQKNIITRAIGIRPVVRPDVFEVQLEECDCILICSDGLTNMIDDAGISRILKTTDTLQEKTEKLIRLANENGGKDNIAVILIEPQISEVKI